MTFHISFSTDLQDMVHRAGFLYYFLFLLKKVKTKRDFLSLLQEKEIPSVKITFIIDFFRKFSIIKSAILGLVLMLKIYNLSKKDLTMLKIYNLSKKDLTMLIL